MLLCFSGQNRPLSISQTVMMSRNIYILMLLACYYARVVIPFAATGRYVATTTTLIVKHQQLCMAGELGELATPPPPRLEDELLRAARKQLSWETSSTLLLENNDEEDCGPLLWENGEHWLNSREMLVKLWVLPRDMSNGADSKFAAAASKQEQKMLEEVPQLLRLPSSQVIESAKAVHKHFPPAVLRSEPMLLAYPASYIQGGLDHLSSTIGEKEMFVKCRDTPSALVEAIEEWMSVDNNKLTP